MRPEICKNCGANDFLPTEDGYVCTYCDSRHVTKQAVPAVEVHFNQAHTPQPKPDPTPVTASSGKAKNKWVALLLCVVLGYYGGHKFYEGKIIMGLIYLFTQGLFGIGWIVDIFILLFKPNPYYV